MTQLICYITVILVIYGLLKCHITGKYYRNFHFVVSRFTQHRSLYKLKFIDSAISTYAEVAGISSEVYLFSMENIMHGNNPFP